MDEDIEKQCCLIATALYSLKTQIYLLNELKMDIEPSSKEHAEDIFKYTIEAQTNQNIIAEIVERLLENCNCKKFGKEIKSIMDENIKKTRSEATIIMEEAERVAKKIEEAVAKKIEEEHKKKEKESTWMQYR